MQIERKRGDTYADEFTVLDKLTWEPANLTGSTCLLTLDSRQAPTDSLTQVYQLVGQIVPLEGKVLCAPSLVQANRVGRFYYDLQLTDATGKVRTIASGTYLYQQDITK